MGAYAFGLRFFVEFGVIKSCVLGLGGMARSADSVAPQDMPYNGESNGQENGK